MNNVPTLPASESWSPEQALQHCLNIDLKQVLIIGLDDDHRLVVRSSKMRTKDAIYLLKLADMFVTSQIDLEQDDD